ncbi:MAG: metal-dependent hydrolase, partial [Vicinamibacterales bacterium]
AGLKHKTRFGTAALVIAANLPDVDVLAFATATPSVALRRGWTHGILAQILLPILLTCAFVLFDKWRTRTAAKSDQRPAKTERRTATLRRAQGRPELRRGTNNERRTANPEERSSVRFSGLLLLCYAGVLSHVAMDWLNNYGVRLFMPFSGRWFYGDAVFIIDPWLWLTLAAGYAVARRVGRPPPARIAVVAATVYILLMTLSAIAARQHVAAAWTRANGTPPAALMVGPAPIDPFRKSVIVDAGEHYWRGTFRWWPARLEWDAGRVPRQDRHPAAMRASHDPAFRALLGWARFPYYEITRSPGGTRVTLGDMRFGRGPFTVETVVPDQ